MRYRKVYLLCPFGKSVEKFGKLLGTILGYIIGTKSQLNHSPELRGCLDRGLVVVAPLLVDHLVRRLEVPLQPGVGLELLEALRAGLARHEALLGGHRGSFDNFSQHL